MSRKAMKEFTSPQYRLSVVNDYTVLWKNYFQYFQEKEVERKFTAAEEQAFEQIMLSIAQNYFRFVEAAGQYLKGSKAILEVLESTPSLAVVHSMSDATFSKTQIDWHTLFIAMNKVLGKLTLIQPKPRK